jgi:hypothetical protein
MDSRVKGRLGFVRAASPARPAFPLELRRRSHDLINSSRGVPSWMRQAVRCLSTVALTKSLLSPNSRSLSPNNGSSSPNKEFSSPNNGSLSPNNGFSSPNNGSLSINNESVFPNNDSLSSDHPVCVLRVEGGSRGGSLHRRLAEVSPPLPYSCTQVSFSHSASCVLSIAGCPQLYKTFSRASVMHVSVKEEA